MKILVHNGDLDAYAAFNELMQKNRAITVQAMERKDDHVLMTLQVPEDVDKAVLEKQFDQLNEENYRLRLRAKISKRLLAQEEQHNQQLYEVLIKMLPFSGDRGGELILLEMEIL